MNSEKFNTMRGAPCSVCVVEVAHTTAPAQDARVDANRLSNQNLDFNSLITYFSNYFNAHRDLVRTMLKLEGPNPLRELREYVEASGFNDALQVVLTEVRIPLATSTLSGART